jgi:hypothetical protein
MQPKRQVQRRGQIVVDADAGDVWNLGELPGSWQVDRREHDRHAGKEILAPFEDEVGREGTDRHNQVERQAEYLSRK